MAAYVNRLRNSIRAFLKHHYGHLHYKLGQFMRTLAELKEDNPGMLAIIMTILTVLSCVFSQCGKICTRAITYVGDNMRNLRKFSEILIDSCTFSSGSICELP